MNEKVDKLQNIFETANLIFIRELADQLHSNNSDIVEAAQGECPSGLKYEVQRVMKSQENLLNLIIKLADELDADFIQGMELLKELGTMKE